MSEVHTANVFGRRSFLMKTNCIDLALTVTGGHLAPVTFFPQDAHSIQPYAIAPWWSEPLEPATPSLLANLRGDFFCSAFGCGNMGPSAGTTLPPHGETANGIWHVMAHGSSSSGCWLQLGMELSAQGGHCDAVTALLSGQSVVYQRHDLGRLTGPINPGHHATLAFPATAGAGRLSFSRLKCAFTYPEPMERAETGGRSSLAVDVEITDLRQVPCTDGSMTDLMRFPARRGFEDLVILCTDPTVELGWSAVTFPENGFVWFSLRNPRQLSCTLLWFSNGGRDYSPWNGRHVNVMGIEDMTGYFDMGLAASRLRNPLTDRGVRTSLDPNGEGRISIPYIQGVARIPHGFDQVAEIEALNGGNRILLRADSGIEVTLPCYAEFLKAGQIPELHRFPVPE
ncbi:MAG TPA: hypothetical protein VN750_20150 [Steroidobacteraceae bacterium]|nr:hypothetical protein [Steroidobacteraceae bacterium]